MIDQTISKSLFEKAQKYIPGGVNSPVRAFKAVGSSPIFIKGAKGPFVFDEDGNRYIELINSWGPMILGHANAEVERAVLEAMPASMSFGAPTRREVEMAELICRLVPGADKVRMVNSGTEATMSAIRVARGYTGKDKIIKFEGCYHGHADAFLIAAGSGAATFGQPDSPGITQNTATDTLIAPYNDLEAVVALVAANKGKIAAIIIEPVAGNMGLVLPKSGFLEGLRAICDRENIVLIFDEVMTGFRLSLGGVQQRLGVQADMVALGKIIGGGLPVGAYAGKAEIMDCVAPLGSVYQAGTLSGNPIAMAAGMAMLTYLEQHPQVYQRLDQIGSSIAQGINDSIKKLDLPYSVTQLGSMYTLFFGSGPIENFEQARTHCNLKAFAHYFNAMLAKGIYLAPSQFESLFVSSVLTDQLIDQVLKASHESLTLVKEAGLAD